MGNLSTETHQETCSCLAEKTPFFPPPRNHFVYCTDLSFSNRSPREVSRLAELCPCLPGGGSSVLSQDTFHMLTDCSQSNQCVCVLYVCAFTYVCVSVHLRSHFFYQSSQEIRNKLVRMKRVRVKLLALCVFIWHPKYQTVMICWLYMFSYCLHLC